jgi:NarL family two-component system sensor histidine kinase YdfH
MIILIVFMLLFRRQLDTNERVKKLAAELETANQQLTEYATQVESLTLTAERQRMARELHDTLAQGVAGLVLQLEAMKAHLAAGRAERAGSIIEQALRRARSTLAESRAAIDDLRVAPANMSEAVKVKIERFTQATGIPCELNMDLGDIVLYQNIEGNILRVLSESLANITRHAQATQVWVSLTVNDKRVELGIRDNGRGFNPDTATKAGHYGVLGMRERARLISGEFLIISEIGKGTYIQLFVPILQES